MDEFTNFTVFSMHYLWLISSSHSKTMGCRRLFWRPCFSLGMSEPKSQKMYYRTCRKRNKSVPQMPLSLLASSKSVLWKLCSAKCGDKSHRSQWWIGSRQPSNCKSEIWSGLPVVSWSMIINRLLDDINHSFALASLTGDYTLKTYSFLGVSCFETSFSSFFDYYTRSSFTISILASSLATASVFTSILVYSFWAYLFLINAVTSKWSKGWLFDGMKHSLLAGLRSIYPIHPSETSRLEMILSLD